MMLIVRGDLFDEEVFAAPFEIEGSTEKFAVHRGIGLDDHLFAATHLETGLRIARGESPEEAIKKARELWASKSPEEIARAIARADTDLGPPGLRARPVEPQ